MSLQPRDTLPCITDSPKSAFLAGWWSGIAIGVVSGLSIAVMIAKVVK